LSEVLAEILKEALSIDLNVTSIEKMQHLDLLSLSPKKQYHTARYSTIEEGCSR